MNPQPDVDKVKDHQLMILAFIKLWELYPDVVKTNQGLLRKYLYPAITSVEKVPQFRECDHEAMAMVYFYLIKMLADTPNTPVTIQIYEFGHQVRQVHQCS